MILLREGMGDLLDGDPMLLPVSSGDQMGLPFLTMGSRDGRCHISAAMPRLDCVVEIADESQDEFCGFARGTLEKLRQILNGFELSRFGCTATLFEKAESPIKRLLETYVSYEMRETCNEIVFRFNEPQEINGTMYNRVVVAQNGFKEDAVHGSVPGVITSLDINTPASLVHIEKAHVDAVLMQINEDSLIRNDGHDRVF